MKHIDIPDCVRMKRFVLMIENGAIDEKSTPQVNHKAPACVLGLCEDLRSFLLRSHCHGVAIHAEVDGALTYRNSPARHDSRVAHDRSSERA